MKTAIVHDWLLSSIGGSEKVVEAIHALYPSPIYTLIQDKKKLVDSYFEKLEIHSSFLRKFPKAKTKYPMYLPLFPMAIEHFDLKKFDLILSSSHCVAKGAMTHPDQLHICYCHTPMRYAWDLMHEYLQESGLNRGIKGALAKFFLHYLRGWDVHSAKRVDHFIANSNHVARRIEKYYGRSSTVIPPPVDLSFFEMRVQKEEYFIAASRLVGYKKIDLIVEAFSKMPDKKLLVIGDGPERKKIEAKAKKNVEMLGALSDAALKHHLQRAKACIFAAHEDFGILSVEAMATGTPVIAFGKGGAKETVVENETGLFFDSQQSDAIVEVVKKFEKQSFDPEKCRKQAGKFSKEQFNKKFSSFVEEKHSEFKAKT